MNNSNLFKGLKIKSIQFENKNESLFDLWLLHEHHDDLQRNCIHNRRVSLQQKQLP